MKQEVRALFVNTPGIEECENYWVVQRLIEHRIRCVMTGSEFSDISRDLVLKFLTAPDDADTPEKMNHFLTVEAERLLNTFNLYEQLPDYQTAIEALKPFAGLSFSITSITMTGFQILIYM